ncbi:MAG: M14 family zinc carboxypeptidase [Gammaproteobacteria bacterium]
MRPVRVGLCGLLLWSACALAAPLPTPLEASGYARISRADELGAYMHSLAARFPDLVRIESLGDSAQGRPVAVMRFAEPRAAEAAPRLQVMVIGSQHGAAEPAGGEALMVIARELAGGDLRPLLADLDVLLLPDANPDGRDLGRRANAGGVNINTDFVLVTQPETRLLKEALSRFAPDALLDSHESAVLKRKTLARDGYLTDFNAQFEISNNPAVPAAIRDYARQVFLPAVIARVTAAGLPAHRYIGEITSIRQPITNGGLTMRNFRNTAGLTGALSLLVETKLDSREDDWPTYRNIAVRVERQLVCIRAFLALVHARRDEIRARTAQARAARHKEPLTLYAGYELDRDHPRVKIPMRRLDTRELEDLEFRDHRRQVDADVIPYPPMLVVTRHQERLREVLERHDVHYWSVAQPTAADVVAARFEGRANIYDRVKLLAETRRQIDIEPGGLFIDLTQPNGRLAALLLDPRATSSVFRYPEFAALVQPDEEFFVYRTFKGATRARP